MSKYYKISSIKRSSGSINDFYMDFNSPIQQGVYKLKQFVIPNTINIVNDTNNKIYFQENGSASILTATLSPNGYYDTTTLASLIGTSMTNISTSSGLAHNYSATYSSVSNKFTISVSGGNSFKFFMSSYTTNSASVLIGVNTDTSAFSGSIVADNVCNLTNNIYSLNINIQSTNILNRIINNVGSYYSFSVPINSGFGDVLCYEPLVDYELTVENATRLVRVSIRDDNENLIPLQNDYYFILERM